MSAKTAGAAVSGSPVVARPPDPPGRTGASEETPSTVNALIIALPTPRISGLPPNTVREMRPCRSSVVSDEASAHVAPPSVL